MNLSSTPTVALLCAAGLCHAAPSQHKMECPPTLAASSIQVAAQDGWTASVLDATRLHSAEPMLGPPESRAFLKPGKTQITRHGSTDSWLELAGPAPNGKWFVCRYGAAGEIVLARRIDDGTSACVVRRERQQIDAKCTW
ncbi:STY0301 family protein [Pseudoduganella sp.]|uniref:STY0301 family protein n=1 Tax=Pseudoduganella sp. TaxID=1880898 RepID=UPI0035B17606